MIITVECYVGDKMKSSYACQDAAEARMWARRFIEQEEPRKKDRLEAYLDSMEALGEALKNNIRYGIKFGRDNTIVFETEHEEHVEKASEAIQPLWYMDRSVFLCFGHLVRVFNELNDEEASMACETIHELVKDSGLVHQCLSPEQKVKYFNRMGIETKHALKEVFKTIKMMDGDGLKILDEDELPF